MRYVRRCRHESTWVPHQPRSCWRASASRSPSMTPGIATAMRCCPAGAYVGAILLITATLSAGPVLSASSTMNRVLVGATSAAKYTQPADCEATAGNDSSALADGPSVATTTARALSVLPSASVTLWAVTAATGELSRTVPGARPAAICVPIAPIPCAGTAESPSDKERKITSKARFDVFIEGSS